MSKTQTRLSNSERLINKLCKKEGYWTAYICDGRLFSEMDDAVRHARQLAKARENPEWVRKTKVPFCVPELNGFSCGAPSATEAGTLLPSVDIYFVNGRPFLTLEEAQTAALEFKPADGQRSTIMYTTIHMDSLDFLGHLFPGIPDVSSTGAA